MDTKLLKFNILLICITTFVIATINFYPKLDTSLKLILSIISIVVIWIIAGYKELKLSHNILKNNKE